MGDPVIKTFRSKESGRVDAFQLVDNEWKPVTEAVTTGISAPRITSAALSAQDEPQFQRWYAQKAKILGINPNPDDPKHFYDYRAAYKAMQPGGQYAGHEPSKEGDHWPSAFKLEGHPRTFLQDEHGRKFDTRSMKYEDGTQVPEGAKGAEIPAAPAKPPRESTKEKLARLHKEAEAPVAAPPEPPGIPESMARGAAHYQTLGAADEAAGLGAASPGTSIPGFGEGSGNAPDLPAPAPVDDRHGPAAGRTVGRGVDSPLMSDEQASDATYEAMRGKYSSRDKAAAAEHPFAFHGSGLASSIPGVWATMGGGAALPEAAVAGAAAKQTMGQAAAKLAARTAVASGTGAATGAAGGALSAEPGHRVEGGESGMKMGALIGGLAEVAMTGARKVGSSLWDWLHNTPDARLLSASGGDVGPVGGFKPGPATVAAQEKSKGMPYAPNAAEAQSRDVVPRAAEAMNESINKTTGGVRNAQRAAFESPEGQRTVPSTEIASAIDEARGKFMLSDKGPVPGDEGSASKFAGLAAKLAHEAVTEGKPVTRDLGPFGFVDTPGEPVTLTMPRDLNAEDTMKIYRKFRDASGEVNTYSTGQRAAFLEVSRRIGKVAEDEEGPGFIATHFPELHKANQAANESLGQMKGALNQIGFHRDTTGIHIDPDVPMAINTREDAFKLGQAIRGAGYDERLALVALNRDRPDVVADLEKVWGTAAYERLGSSEPGLHGNIGLSGPHARLSGGPRVLGTRAASLKNIPGKTGAALAGNTEHLSQMLGLGDQPQETPP